MNTKYLEQYEFINKLMEENDFKQIISTNNKLLKDKDYKFDFNKSVNVIFKRSH
tara:strand:- start:280 stop:441 length:162 start_codon:yes stop_codon:yes gene_type:complete